MLNVYLSGCVKNVDEDFQNWRKKCLEFESNGFYPKLKFIDPTSSFNYWHNQPETDRQCLDLFMWQISESDIVLCNLDHSDSSVGTGMEVERGFYTNKPVIGFGEKPDTWYNWTQQRCSIVFKTLEEALGYINDFYGTVKGR